MSLSATVVEELAATARQAARTAGAIIAGSRPQRVEHKPGAHSRASQVVTEIDHRAEAAILEILGPLTERFDLGTLTEEREDDGGRLHKDYFWCIDPLDGTRPFVEDRPGYAVSIALVSHAGVPEIGVVFDPIEGIVYHARRGGGAWRDGERWNPVRQPPADVLHLFPDPSFVESPSYDGHIEALGQIASDLGLSGVEVGDDGAAVMNACRVLAHPPACYFKLPKPQQGGGSLWDYAATACLFIEAGAVATDMQGRPLDLNRADSTFMNHRGVLFATDHELARRLRARFGAGGPRDGDS